MFIIYLWQHWSINNSNSNSNSNSARTHAQTHTRLLRQLHTLAEIHKLLTTICMGFQYCHDDQVQFCRRQIPTALPRHATQPLPQVHSTPASLLITLLLLVSSTLDSLLTIYLHEFKSTLSKLQTTAFLWVHNALANLLTRPVPHFHMHKPTLQCPCAVLCASFFENFLDDNLTAHPRRRESNYTTKIATLDQPAHYFDNNSTSHT